MGKRDSQTTAASTRPAWRHRPQTKASSHHLLPLRIPSSNLDFTSSKERSPQPVHIVGTQLAKELSHPPQTKRAVPPLKPCLWPLPKPQAHTLARTQVETPPSPIPQMQLRRWLSGSGGLENLLACLLVQSYLHPPLSGFPQRGRHPRPVTEDSACQGPGLFFLRPSDARLVPHS